MKKKNSASLCPFKFFDDKYTNFFFSMMVFFLVVKRTFCQSFNPLYFTANMGITGNRMVRALTLLRKKNVKGLTMFSNYIIWPLISP